ncbi:MAG: succinate dehydrogenase iron-sulfur subunit [Armatimonadetes bacterium JP3_11]|jgi:succinate dehydrogenase / fumarate reductase iron-sulfur subunit|nr:MAG: succinate dehydrogenase iron-sulfur subunit [Armatimonadetes bacterium CP1_7O]OYT74015.1 MAG: succinate dehydrogenase iron-sulfur subunit [Armatimonadetes bacterium JP3_11]
MQNGNGSIRTIRLKVRRQDGPNQKPYWQEFSLPYRPNMNVISCLMEIQRNPVDSSGRPVSPPAWEAACLEQVCGTCTMVVNGMVQQSCAALVDQVGVHKGDTIEIALEPMSKFPVVRDLIVDRSRMFDALKKLQAWVPMDGYHDLGPGPRVDDATRELRYAFARCMTCGCCMEACPQYNEHSAFIGPAPIAQAKLFNLHYAGATLANERLEVLTGPEGITGCGNAQNCVKVCPKGIPLTRAIAELHRDTTIYRLKKWLGIIPDKLVGEGAE